MNFLKGIGAFLYSFVHSWLIDLIVIGMIYVIINILSLSWFWVLIILLCLMTFIETIRNFLLALLVAPYSKLANKSSKVLILPIIVLIINAIWYFYNIWISDDIPSTLPFFYKLILTYQIVVATWVSIVVMLPSQEENQEQPSNEDQQTEESDE